VHQRNAWFGAHEYASKVVGPVSWFIEDDFKRRKESTQPIGTFDELLLRPLERAGQRDVRFEYRGAELAGEPNDGLT
jgi:hypothetical protein